MESANKSRMQMLQPSRICKDFQVIELNLFPMGRSVFDNTLIAHHWKKQQQRGRCDGHVGVYKLTFSKQS